MDTTTEGADPLERFLVGVGAVPMAVEPYLPQAVRRNFGARVFALAVVSIVIAPGVAVVAFSEVFTAIVFVSAVVTVTGFLGYCEMYRALREINDRVERVDDGQFDIDFGVDRVDEIGETYTALERTARSLGDTIAEAEQARETAEEATREAEAARERAEDEREEVRSLNDHVERKAAAFSRAMAAAADGDLTVRMDPESENEAMTEIAEAFNGMMADLSATVERVRGFADEVAEASERVTADADANRETSERVSAAVDGIAADADDQSDGLREVAGEMQGLSGTVEEVASSVDEIATTSEETAALGETGSDAAAGAVEEMAAIETAVDEAVAEVESLAADVDEIGDAVDLIADIAEQTNMLALNASIEAARAGEAGEGFAVVADEIKGLADEAAGATVTVESLIEDVQTSTSTAVADIREMGDRVDAGAETVETALDALDEIADNVAAVDRSVQEINAATDDQAAATEEVASMVDDVFQTAEEISAEADDVADAARDQTDSLDDVRESVDSLSERAGALRDLLAEFDTDGTGSAVDRPSATAANATSATDGGTGPGR